MPCRQACAALPITCHAAWLWRPAHRIPCRLVLGCWPADPSARERMGDYQLSPATLRRDVMRLGQSGTSRRRISCGMGQSGTGRRRLRCMSPRMGAEQRGIGRTAANPMRQSAVLVALCGGVLALNSSSVNMSVRWSCR